jgi:hypothetical protein
MDETLAVKRSAFGVQRSAFSGAVAHRRSAGASRRAFVLGNEVEVKFDDHLEEQQCAG